VDIGYREVRGCPPLARVTQE